MAFRDTIFNKIKQHLILREGVRNYVYADSLGKLTGGIGHLIRPNDNFKLGDIIPQYIVEKWFKEDAYDAIDDAIEQADMAGLAGHIEFICALTSVCFQLGGNWYKEWPNTWKMICNGEYERAAVVVENSKWSKQTPVRTKDFTSALRKLQLERGGFKIPKNEMKNTEKSGIVKVNFKKKGKYND